MRKLNFIAVLISSLFIYSNAFADEFDNSNNTLTTSETTSETTSSNEVSNSISEIDGDAKKNNSTTSEIESEKDTINFSNLSDDSVFLDEPINIDGFDYYPANNETDFRYQFDKKRNIVLKNDVTITKSYNVFDGFRVSGKSPNDTKINKLNIQTSHGASSSFYNSSSKTDINTNFSDLEIYNSNYYGIICYYSGVTGKQTYDNVTYYSDKAQAFWMPNGIAEIIDSNFTVTGKTGTSQEFGEFSHLIVGGKSSLTHDSYSNSVNTYAFMNTAGGSYDYSYIDILPNSDVSIETSKTLVYYNVYSSFDINIGDNSIFNLNIGGDLFSSPDSSKSINYNIGKNSTFNLIDDKNNYSTTGYSQNLIPFSGYGTINFGEDSNTDIYTNKRNYIFSQNQYNSPEINIPNNINLLSLQNDKLNGGFYNLYNTNYGVKTNGNVLNMYSKGSLINTFINDYSSIKFYNNNPTILNTNSYLTQNNFINNYKTSSKLVYTRPQNVELFVNDYNFNQNNLTGSTNIGATVWINYTDINGNNVTDSIISTDGSFDFQLKSKVKKNSYINVNASIGGANYNPITSLSIQAIYSSTPTADVNFKEFNINNLDDINYDDLLDNISEPTGEDVSIIVNNKYINEIGLQKSNITLVNESGNDADFDVYAFIYDDNSQIINTSTNKYLLNNKYYSAFDYQVSNDVNDFIKNNLNYRIWNSRSEFSKDSITIKETDLVEIPDPGEYYAILSVDDVNFKIYINIESTTSNIDVSLPKTIKFGTLDIFNGNVISPIYEVRNNNDKDVYIKFDNFEVINDAGIGDKLKLDLIIDNEIINNKNILLNGNDYKNFSIKGHYSGDYSNVLIPKYKVNFNISQGDLYEN